MRVLSKINAFLASLVRKQHATVAARRASLTYQLCTCGQTGTCTIHGIETYVHHTPGCCSDPDDCDGSCWL